MEQRSYSPPARTRVAAIRRRPHPPRPTQRKQNTLRNILWSCLCDYGEDMTAECRPQFAFTWRGVQYTWNRLPQGWKHSPTICHGLIQTALEKGGAPEHLQYIDDIIVWGNTAEEVFKKAGDNGPTWSLWQKAPGETRGRPLGFWSRGYRGSEANYTPTEKEILAAYEGVRAASEVIGTEAQLLLAPRLPVLGWMFKGKVPSTHHATDATWSKWVALITQRARIGNPNRPGIVEVITNWPEGKDSTMPPEEVVTRAEEAPPYNELSDNEKQCVLFTDGSCRIVGKHRKWKAAVWSPTRRVAEATEGEGESSQFAEVKAIQLALDIAEREKWPILYLYTDSWMVANALWGWLKQWKQRNWQRRGKPIWAAELWQDIAERLGKLVVKDNIVVLRPELASSSGVQQTLQDGHTTCGYGPQLTLHHLFCPESLLR
ncbi:uncharacterized protein FN964_010298 [Alca torda]